MRCSNVLVSLLLVIACGDDDGAMDAGRDATRPDGGMLDAVVDAVIDSAIADVGADVATDGGLTDGGSADTTPDAPPSEGFGTITGPCFRVAAELDEPTPSFFQTRLDFADDPFDDPEDLPLLTAGAREILEEGTAGGSSEVSEAFAFEVLARCENATLLFSETEIEYTSAGSMTDMLVEIDGLNVGVSVVRAFIFPPSDPYPVSEADAKITEKLMGILESSANVRSDFAWVKQILVVVAYADMHAESVMTAWGSIPDEIRADTIVYVVTTDGADDPLY